MKLKVSILQRSNFLIIWKHGHTNYFPPETNETPKPKNSANSVFHIRASKDADKKNLPENDPSKQSIAFMSFVSNIFTFLAIFVQNVLITISSLD